MKTALPPKAAGTFVFFADGQTFEEVSEDMSLVVVTPQGDIRRYSIADAWGAVLKHCAAIETPVDDAIVTTLEDYFE